MSSATQFLINACGQTDIGRKREKNEDCFLIADLTGEQRRETNCALEFISGKFGCLFAVADGMGGALAGPLASRLGVRTIYNQAQVSFHAHPLLDDETVEHVLDEAMIVANNRIFGAAKTPGCDGMGTTMTLAFALRGRVILGHVGDSRAYLLRDEGIGQLTLDQTVVAGRLMRGELTEAEARFHADRNLLLQALGAQPEVKPAFSWITLHPWDILLLCSDGLHDQMEIDDIYRIVADSVSLDKAAANLIDLANRLDGPDNITVVLARFLPESEEERMAGLKERGSRLFL